MASEPHAYGDRDGNRGRFAEVRALQVGYCGIANIQEARHFHMAIVVLIWSKLICCKSRPDTG